MNYCCESRVFEGSWIAAPIEYLNTLEAFPKMDLTPGQWIWPQAHVRGFLRKDIKVEKEIVRAKLELWCDNLIDVYINCSPVSIGKNYTGVLEIGECIQNGINSIAVRIYQTNSPLWISAAMHGCVVLQYTDGSKEQLPTDSSWLSYATNAFYQEREPEHWMEPELSGSGECPSCLNIHPRLIRRSCYFRKRIRIEKPVAVARLYGTAKGVFEVFINGTGIDNAVLSPGISEKYTEYRMWDVSELLGPGDHTVAIWLGNGWYNCESWGQYFAKRPELLAELEIVYSDGSIERIGTDTSWELASSPLVENDLQFGERYDARLEIPGWNGGLKNANGADGGNWVSAEICPDVNEKQLVLQNYPPIRKIRFIRPVSQRNLGKNCTLYDFGANAAGRGRVVLKNCKEGEIVKIQYYEMLDERQMPWEGPYVDVFFPNDSLPGGKASWNRRNVDVYICKGEAGEKYEPRFAYTGFRYICVETETAEVECVEMMTIHSDLTQTGKIESEYPLIGGLWDRITRSYCSAIVAGPSVDPSREKNFWNGDIQVFAHTACWFMDNCGILARWTDGGRKMQYNVYGWEDEEYILPLTLYQFYGDKEIVRVKYPVVIQLLAKRREKMRGLFPEMMNAPYRDHQAIENGMSSEYYASCYYCLQLQALARMADILGLQKECEEWNRQYEEVRTAFLEEYYDSETGDLGQNCQGGQVLPLAFHMIPETECRKVMNRLLYYIEKADYHLTTGFMATEHLLGLLCDYGHSHIAWRIFTQKDFPSWQYMISTGATTITENWYGETMERRWDSTNLYSLGNVGRWFFEYLGGIRVDECEPGFEELVVKPVFIPEIGSFHMEFQSVKGKIISDWKAADGKVRWSLQIPDRVKACVYLPDGVHVCTDSYACEFAVE